MMRQIKYIAVHGSAGSQRNTAADIVAYHTRPKSRGGLGWSRPGYHYIIEADGAVVPVWDIAKSSNGVGPQFNPVTINVCWIGGVDTSTKALTPVDNRTHAQRAALRSLLTRLKKQFPDAVIRGHRDFHGVRKACPCFDAINEYADL